MRGSRRVRWGARCAAAAALACASSLSGASAANAASVPAKPDLLQDSGRSSTDDVTNAADTRFAVSFVLDPESWRVELDGAVVASGVMPESPRPNFVDLASIAEGVHTLSTVSATAGGPEVRSEALTFVIDRTSPAEPSRPDLRAEEDTGRSSSDDITNVITPTFTGTAEPGSHLRLHVDGAGTWATATVGSDGVWLASFAYAVLTEHAVAVTATAEDLAGNHSESSPGLPLLIDTAPPRDLRITLPLRTTEHVTTTAPNLVVSGVAEPAAIVRVAQLVAGEPLPPGGVTVVADAAGAWSTVLTAAAPAGRQQVVVIDLVDRAGNTGWSAGGFTWTVDPPAPAMSWVLAADGRVEWGPRFGDLRGVALSGPPKDLAIAPDGLGYWIVGADGGVFTFGSARFFGSTGDLVLNQPILGMAPTPTGRGYWLVARDGGIFSFGDAEFFGSTGDRALNAPVIGIAATPTGKGYWLIAADGGVFTFGDAEFVGSTGDRVLNQPIVDLVATPTGGGYWLVARDGGIFGFGDAEQRFFGSGPQLGARDVVGMAADRSGDSYLLLQANGVVHTFVRNSASSSSFPFGPAVAIAATPRTVPPAVTDRSRELE